MSHPSNSEDRRKALILKIPQDFKDIASWPGLGDEPIEEKFRPRFKALRRAAKLFLMQQSAAEIGKAANMRPSRALDYLERALEPWIEGTGINQGFEVSAEDVLAAFDQNGFRKDVMAYTKPKTQGSADASKRPHSSPQS